MDWLDCFKIVVVGTTTIFISSIIILLLSKSFIKNITYIEDGNYIDAIEYENKIYLRKEGI